ncbi:MAG: nucleoside hydrolase [Bryobacteraceae bacterium]|nr:nucleoside hydrolase [Bryobacteraceae bacterium]
MRTYLPVFLLLLALPASADAPRMKVILDTDIGGDIDDAWALGFVLSYAGFEPVGVTISDGNTPARARVACKMLRLAGRDDIPVAVGRKTNDDYAHQFAWAEDFQALKPGSQSAADFIVERIKKEPGEITLIAVGPLQNVADALRREPALGKYVKRVVLMSGCIYGRSGKKGAIPEWNVRAAGPDAQRVYAAGLPLTIVPLDSTTRVQLSDGERERLRAYRSPLTYALESLYRLWLDNPRSRMTLHDQLAVAETAKPGAFFGKIETLPLVVDEEGYTRIDQARGKPVAVCLEPKRDAFMDYYIGQLVGQRLGM